MFSENDVQVLVVTTQKNDGLELYRRMNLQTDAVISNQGNEVSYKENILNGKKFNLFQILIKELEKIETWH